MTTGLNEKLYSEVWIGLHQDPKQPLVWRWINVKEMSTASSKYDLLSITRSSDYSYVSVRIYRATTEEV
ncbi:hypothetical protein AMECASPLE_028981 [Ameca splendens]|uniref:Uncharacterized protein n=1 Tax=Ameca splendens TaxID=208324 RepID=A0ABV0XIN1_9TELE